jgi:hypothetical protein
VVNDSLQVNYQTPAQRVLKATSPER